MPKRKQRANAIRVLSMDAVQQANSGHPGMPMGMADIAEVLWFDHLHHNPHNPQWSNRDRFVLSNGHGSMLLYSLLHLTGYDVSTDDLRQFRQLHSNTPGHPEYGYTPGVETTTGPLGQGISMAVGMALAEKLLAAEFNRDSHTIVDHYTYVFLGDGCLMEGISHESCALAGTWQLNKLIAFWDDNNISIDGEVTPWFTDNTPQRFKAYGWQVIENVDGHDSVAINQAIVQAKTSSDKPTLICCKTQIGCGAPGVAGTAKCHGAPLGDKEIMSARNHLAWSHEPFIIPRGIYDEWDARATGEKIETVWKQKFDAYAKQYPELAAEFTRRQQRQLPEQWPITIENLLITLQNKAETVATRKASQQCLNALAPRLPEIIGGSADLTESNNTNWTGMKTLSQTQWPANYIHYGVREFGMSAIMNGITVHGGFIAYGGTFLVFSDYARNAVRIAALMQIPTIFIYSHDSIFLGEDGPTHQPIEHIASLRVMPNLQVWRPCDTIETAIAWQLAIESKNTPSALLLTRQNLSFQARDAKTIENIKRGGYILQDSNGEPEMIIMATGSEVDLAVQAVQQLQAKHIRIVSMPCVELFLQQDVSYQQQVLPDTVTKRLAIEAGVRETWYRFVGPQGKIIGIDHFGASAPAAQLAKEFGFTVDHVVDVLKQLIRGE